MRAAMLGNAFLYSPTDPGCGWPPPRAPTQWGRATLPNNQAERLLKSDYEACG